MSKTKAIIGSGVVIGLVAFAASPAFALFESSNAKTTGSSSATEMSFTDEGLTFICKSVVGEWSIFSLTKQEATKKGAHQVLKVTKWGTCTAFGTNLTMKPCSLELKQSSGSNKAVLSVLTECVFTAPSTCEIKVPVTKNSNLTKIDFTNVGTNLEMNFKVEGITSTATSLGLGCMGITNLTNKVGTLKGVIIGEGEKFV